MQVKGIRLGGVYKGDYTVFSDGRIYSNKSGKYLKHDTSHSKNGLPYHRVTLCQNGHTKRFMVSRLVAWLFVANPMNKPQVDHIDGDVSNNDYTNLQWVTAQENMIKRTQAKAHLRKGRQHFLARYSQEQIDLVKEHHRKGYSRKQSMRLSGVTESAIKDIRAGRSSYC